MNLTKEPSSITTDIAIIGMSCRFPGANNIGQFWKNLCTGIESISFWSREQLETAGIQPAVLDDPSYVKAGAILCDVQCFDSHFFGIPPREANFLDPQQRIFLECAWHALEDAGYASADHGKVTGVYAGAEMSSYLLRNILSRPDQFSAADWFQIVQANDKDFLPTRASYKLNLHGPSVAVQTGCSTSLVATHLACQAIINGECDIALAGGACIRVPHLAGYVYREGLIDSCDGHCRPFDFRAQGTVFGSGVGVVVLKRLGDALKDRDCIYAVIKGSAVNNDGSAKVGYTAPSIDGQTAVITEALDVAAIAPETIGYVETHGTGTALGDPVEIAALTKAFRRSSRQRQYCALGAVKGNIGHLASAAGVAGLIKAALTVHHGIIPPTVGYEAPNPNIDFEASPFYINSKLAAWRPNGARRRAGVSSFGIGGTNAHIILEEAPLLEVSGHSRQWHLIAISAKSQKALRDLSTNLADYLDKNVGLSVGDVAFSLNTGRRAFPFRRFAVCREVGDVVRQLASLPENLASGTANVDDHQVRVVFMFSNQAQNLVGNGRTLYRHELPFRLALNHCRDIIQSELELDLCDILFPVEELLEKSRAHLNRCAIAEPVLFSLEYAFAELLKAWGISPHAMLGCGLGEFVAACLAGVFSIEDALRIVIARAAVNDAFDERKSSTIAFQDVIRSIEFQEPRIPFISSVTGEWISLEDAVDHNYWLRQLHSVVRIENGIREMLKSPVLFIQVGPGSDLCEHTKQCNVSGNAATVVSTCLPADSNESDLHCLFEAIGQLWIAGAKIHWDQIYDNVACRRIPLPCYPFERTEHWIEPAAALAKPTLEVDSQDNVVSRQEPDVALSGTRGKEFTTASLPTAGTTYTSWDFVTSRVRSIFGQLLGIAPSSLELERSFVSLGADSLLLIQVSQQLQREFGLPVPVDSLLEELSTAGRLAQFLSKAEVPVRGDISTITAGVTLPAVLGQKTQSPDPKLRHEHRQTITPASPVLPFGRANNPGPSELNRTQREYLIEFIAEYTQRTAGSRERAAKHRGVLADPRLSTKFRLMLKELVYPIAVERGFGARICDVDGNEYVDLSMGFGVCLFGQSPQFVTRALQDCLVSGMGLGPQCAIVGDVAEMVCDLTGMARVAFCNSGTEAVMAAIRLARTVSGRDRIACFTGSYHGFYDGTLVRDARTDTETLMLPAVPGITTSVAEDTVVLEYGAASALEQLHDHSLHLAAVLVEPVQSRRPDYQPVEFLHELRAITQQTGTALIFDEMITGFRVHQGGAQTLFGIRADLATYGKILGGGLPLGVVAGTAKYMDACDGGTWAFGDSSRPSKTQTFFAGTFSKHPLAMTAAYSVLCELKRIGPALQERLNIMTNSLAGRLNTFFITENVPFRVASFSSMFRFICLTDEMVGDLFRHHLIAKGIYVWEGGTCFLSVAHSERDLDLIFFAVSEAVAGLQRGKFLMERLTRSAEPAVEHEHDQLVVSADQLGPNPHRSSALPDSPRNRAFPLIGPQKHLWLATQSSQNASVAYNESLVVKFSGALDTEALLGALSDIVSRHDALRATFYPSGQSQYIQDHLDIHLSRANLSELPANSHAPAIRDWISKEVQLPFDLAAGPLLRASLGVLGRDQHILVLTVHHLACDAVSMAIVHRDLAACYSSRARGETPRSQGNRQFTEFIAWLQDQELCESMNASEEYWSKHFTEVPERLSLATDRPRPTTATFSGARQHAILPRQIALLFLSLGASHGCTPLMSFLAVFCLLLHRLTGQNDIVVGVPASLRDTQHAEIVGYCLSIMPIRSCITNETTGSSLLKAIRATVAAAMQHRLFSLGHLTEKLGDKAPSIASIFNFDRSGDPAPVFQSVQTELLEPDSRTSKFDISVNVQDKGSNFHFAWEYDTDLFGETTISRWIAYYENLLRAFVEQPGCAVQSLPIMGPNEYQRVVELWNTTDVPFTIEEPIHRLFEWRAQLHPDIPAAIFGSSSLTYRELDARSNFISRALREFRIGPELRVAICMERSLDLLSVILGVFKVGGVVLPLHPAMPPDRLSVILDDAQPHLIIIDSKASTVFNSERRVVDLSTLRLKNQPNGKDFSREVSSDNAAYILYTSGSTGAPKGVIGTYGGLRNRLLWMQNQFNLDSSDRVLQKTPVTFDVALWELLWPLITGATVIIAEPGAHRDAARLADLIQEHQVTTVHFVPSLLGTFLDAADLKACTSIRRIICSGEELSREIQERCFARLNVELYNLYGPTEASIDVTAWRCSSRANDQSTVPIGTPISNTQVYILDAALWPTPPGVAGELYIAGIGLARGYVGRPDLTAEQFLPNPFDKNSGTRMYKTGDRARFREDGVIEFLGRTDRQVKINGVRIEIGEIEATLAAQPAIAEAAVILRKEGRKGSRLVAYLSLQPGAVLVTQELRRELLKFLPPAAVPAEFVQMERLPRSSSGKIDRAVLPVPGEQSDERPRYTGTRLEHILAAIWSEVLGVNHITSQDNFIHLGGDSIQAIRVAARARERGIPLAVGRLLQRATIEEIVAELPAPGPSSYEIQVLPSKMPLTPIQHWFFECAFPEPHHFNQSLLLELNAPLDVSHASLASVAVLRHHEMLGARFERGMAVLPGPGTAARAIASQVFSAVDLTGLSQREFSGEVEKLAAEMQGSLSLSDGPLFRIALFLGSTATGNRLLFIAHHLVVDSVSWQFIVRDFESAYEQLAEGQEPCLPLKTASYTQWSNRLSDYAMDAQNRVRLPVWLTEPSVNTVRITSSVAESDSLGSIAVENDLTLRLTEEKTRSLTQAIQKIDDLALIHVLVGCLLDAVYRSFAGTTVQIDVEGHGRIHSFTDLDLSRTVGWFTTLYPVVFSFPAFEVSLNCLRSVRDRLHDSRDWALDYGVLRYLSNGEQAQQLKALPKSEILFNYLGDIDGTLIGTRLFRIARERVRATQSERSRCAYPMEINAAIRQRRLEVTWTFNPEVITKFLVNAIARRFSATIDQFVINQKSQYSSEIRKIPFHSSGYEYAAPSESGDTLEIMLSPQQAEMVSHSERGAYCVQWICTLSGPLSVSLLKSVWADLTRKHVALRLGIRYSQSGELCQVICEDAMKWAEQDWTSHVPEKQEIKLEQLLVEQRASGFGFDGTLLTKFRLIRVADDRYVFVWCFHHAVLDGWSMQLVLDEFVRLCKGDLSWKEPTDRAFEARAYQLWLQRQDMAAAQNFWQSHLIDYVSPPLLSEFSDFAIGNPGDVFAEMETKLPPDTGSALQKFATEISVTRSALIQAAWAIVLMKRLRSIDVIFGVTSSGRDAEIPGIDRAVGMFLNTVPARAKASPDTKLIDWIRELHDLQVERQRHSWIPLKMIGDCCGQPDGVLFESALRVQNFPKTTLLDHLDSDITIEEIRMVDFWHYSLSLAVTPEGAVGIYASYRRDRFSATFVRGLLALFGATLEALLDLAQDPLEMLRCRLHSILQKLENGAIEFD
jgi:amino acid adenylation domain-containing protein/non-ribosomal peptide synthase protein (TIGR01720 family)